MTLTERVDGRDLCEVALHAARAAAELVRARGAPATPSTASARFSRYCRQLEYDE